MAQETVELSESIAAFAMLDCGTSGNDMISMGTRFLQNTALSHATSKQPDSVIP